MKGRKKERKRENIWLLQEGSWLLWFAIYIVMSCVCLPTFLSTYFHCLVLFLICLLVEFDPNDFTWYEGVEIP